MQKSLDWKNSLIIVALLFFLLNSFCAEIYANESGSGNDYDDIIREIASKFRIDVPLIHSIIRAESNYNSSAVSPKGAIGLMQLMPATAKQYGVKNLYDPQENIEGGVKYLNDLIRAYRGKTDLVLAAYNAGPEAVEKYGGIPPYPETRNYIQRVRSFGFSKSTIRHKTKIYKFYDKSGRMVITNDFNLVLMNKRKSDPSTQ